MNAALGEIDLDLVLPKRLQAFELKFFDLHGVLQSWPASLNPPSPLSRCEPRREADLPQPLRGDPMVDLAAQDRQR